MKATRTSTRTSIYRYKVRFALLSAAAVFGATAAAAADLSDLKIAAEDRCAPYKAKSYRYPANLDRLHLEAEGYRVDEDGKVRNAYPSPYTPGISFRYLQDMDIEHIVARSEAHDSGLCARPSEWTPFASDRLNITVAGEHVNRTLKRDKDPAEWLPDIGKCSYARRWIAVKLKYGLTADQAEHDVLKRTLRRCKRREP